MRDSNYKSVAANKAAVTITTSLYDRRALDVTSDKPLVNSLNHLTYLVLSSAKVRETLSNDGGMERLIEILHECHNSTFNLADNIFNSEKKLLTAWKWTLAFQCLVLIGTRGTERIRQKVVKAGMLPIIVTVLDNYLTLHERSFTHANLRLDPVLDANNPSPSGPTGPTSGPTGPTSAPSGPSPHPSAPSGPSSAVSSAGPTGTSASVASGTGPTRFQNISANPDSSQLDLPSNPYSPSLPSELPQPYFHAENLTCDDFDNLSVDQLLKLVYTFTCKPLGNNDIKRRYLIVNIIKKLREEKAADVLDAVQDSDYLMDSSLQFLLDMYLQEDRSSHIGNLANAKAAPRNFTETGVVIPRDDDIVWSLQLLAYISKYPHLKEVLQNTHLVIDMSIRDKQLKMYVEKQKRIKDHKKQTLRERPTITPKLRKRLVIPTNAYLERFDSSASSSPQMLGDIVPDLVLDHDKLDLTGQPDDGLVENAEADDSDRDDDDDDDDDDDEYLSELATHKDEPASGLSALYDCMMDAECIVNDMDREIALVHLSDKINRCIEVESKHLTNTIVKKRIEQKEYLTKKWDYDTYANFDVDEDDTDFDESLVEYKKVNLFPMVEKFTFLSGTDMYYWSGVIMRNSCRRNDLRGGVRQCGNLDCGRWEQYPREFLKCRRCKRTKYCSRECQMRAWHCHRNWCIPSTNSNTTGTEITNAEEHNDSS